METRKLFLLECLNIKLMNNIYILGELVFQNQKLIKFKKIDS